MAYGERTTAIRAAKMTFRCVAELGIEFTLQHCWVWAPPKYSKKQTKIKPALACLQTRVLDILGVPQKSGLRQNSMMFTA